MSAASITAGIIFFALSTFARSLLKDDIASSKISLQRWIGIPAKENRDGILGFPGQLMGILWIVNGIFLDKVEKRLPPHSSGVIVKFLIVLAILTVRWDTLVAY